ncbi:MAG TPA: N-6 DNA methylase [Actinomyces sp.]|nr:N-6 DNA methylase [Actinomyces sp.]
MQAVAARAFNARPDLNIAIGDIISVEPSEQNPLENLSIGEIGVCYEAVKALQDSGVRRQDGQYFTPDDAARFMAEQSLTFPPGRWVDPCCGVGNLAWHLTEMQSNPEEFVKNQLVLNDKDKVALKTAVVLLGAQFLALSDQDGMREMMRSATADDFLDSGKTLEGDYVIVNPPYGRTEERGGFDTAKTKENFSYFMEKITKQFGGFISVTPASYVSAPKFKTLRQLIDRHNAGGDVYVFDNVPDTLFRGYKFGSSNTSKTNFVRAAITVTDPSRADWRITPIVRWKSKSRTIMFREVGNLLSKRMIGPDGSWAKIPPGFESVWEALMKEGVILQDLLVKGTTEYSLNVALTPRYYISATFRDLERRSKKVLYFANEEDRDRAAIVLNSSLPYIWWRALDGGVTLPLRVLLSTPIPSRVDASDEIIEWLRVDEEESLVTKLNAGIVNENVKRPQGLVDMLNQIAIPHAREFVDFFYSDDVLTDHS